jgi:hypothetical protein
MVELEFFLNELSSLNSPIVKEHSSFFYFLTKFAEILDECPRLTFDRMIALKMENLQKRPVFGLSDEITSAGHLWFTAKS